MGNSLEAPKTDKDGELFQSHTGLLAAGVGMQGWRIEMEDSHIAKDIPSRPDHLFLGVWDGHAGAGAAKYASENMIQILEDTNEWKEYVAGDANDIELLGKAMTRTFIKIDEMLRTHQELSYGQDSSGCTSVTAIVTPTHILCANAGDSRCAMGTKGTALALSDDHKPMNQVERQRIESAGGFLQWNRVDGDLAVSRALGDFSYKNRPDLPAEQQKVSCEPDIAIVPRDESDDILLLACDGLWDVMSTDEAISQVRELFALGEEDLLKVAEEMLDKALEKGSKDNISVMLVKLPGAKIGPVENGGVGKIREERQRLIDEQKRQEDLLYQERRFGNGGNSDQPYYDEDN